MVLQGVPENSLHFLKMLSFLNCSSLRVNTILILKLIAPALKWVLTLCRDVSRSRVVVKLVLQMEIQNSQKWTTLEKIPKQRFMEYFQTPLQLMCSLLLSLFIIEDWSRDSIIKHSYKYKLQNMARNIEKRINNIPRRVFMRQKQFSLQISLTLLFL